MSQTDNPEARGTPEDERVLRIEAAAGTILVEAHRHTWIALDGPGGPVAVEHGGSTATSFTVGAGTYTIRSDGQIDGVSIHDAEQPMLTSELPADPEVVHLRLMSDASDQHEIDGVPEMQADGESSCTITVETLTPAGAVLPGRDDEVFVRSTGGVVVDMSGEALRSLRLDDGRARFRLVSEATPRLVTVEAFGRPPLARAELRIEFVRPR
jgi:hypothetical protein